MHDNHIERVFGTGGLISKFHENYEYRSGQIKMAEAVAQAFAEKRHLIVEAGTGTGKTLAYLIPAISAALQTKKRIIISTGTKNLQEQLMEKDIPFLQKVLPKKFTAAYMKGRSNYACLYRIQKADNQPILDGLDQKRHFDEVRDWSRETKTGDRRELVDLPEDLSFWSRINAKGETCIGQKCPEFEPCFITRMRVGADAADIVIVNHHLFFADLNVRGNQFGKVIPDYGAVIFDEAHLIEDIAADYFGFQVSNFQIDELVRDSVTLPISDAIATRDIDKTAAKISGLSEQFWIRFIQARTEGRFPLQPDVFAFRSTNGEQQATPLGEAYFALDSALQRLETQLDAFGETIPEADSVVRRTRQTRFDLDFIVTQAERNYVYWLEKRGKGIFPSGIAGRCIGTASRKAFRKSRDMHFDLGDAFEQWQIRFHPRTSRPRHRQDDRHGRTVRVRLRKAGNYLLAKSDARPAFARIYTACRRRDRQDTANHKRPSVRAFNEQRIDEGSLRTGLVTRQLPVFCTGIDVENRLARKISRNAERRTFRHRKFLAGRRCTGRTAFVRDHRQAPIRRPDRSDSCRPLAICRRKRRQFILRLQRPASRHLAKTGHWPPDPQQFRPRRNSPSRPAP